VKKVNALVVVIISVFVSCKKEKEREEMPISTGEIVVEKPFSKECYIFTTKRDTVSMTLNIKGNLIATGKLSYKFFEKDKNEGDLAGQIRGDTLVADYTFMSEGVSSIRQVAFLKKGNTFAEGYGDVVDDNKGKVTFKDLKKIKFDGKMVLAKVNCKLLRIPKPQENLK
jgi:hypothetical protein